MKKPRIVNDSHATSYLTAAFMRHEKYDDNFEEFAIDTKYGIVSGYKVDGSVSMRFIAGGRKHFRRVEGKSYSRKGTITLARRFADEIVRSIRFVAARRHPKPTQGAKP